jgi:hypothetical protein
VIREPPNLHSVPLCLREIPKLGKSYWTNHVRPGRRKESHRGTGDTEIRKLNCDSRASQSPSVPLCLREIPKQGKPYWTNHVRLGRRKESHRGTGDTEIRKLKCDSRASQSLSVPLCLREIPK